MAFQDESTIEVSTKRTDGAVWYRGGRLNATTPAGIMSIFQGVVHGSGIAPGTISGNNIANRAVTTVKMALNAVDESIVAAGAISETKIATDAITSPKIFAGAVVAGKLAAGSVLTNNLIAGAVTTIKIAVSGVQADRIAANAITAVKIATNAIESIHVGAYQITAVKLGSGTIDTQKITISGTGVNGQIDIDAQTADGSPAIRVAKQGDTKVLMGNLKEKTGVEEYGLWIKGESLYLGGYKLYDAIATKEGVGDTTQVYYNGQTYTSIKEAIDAAEANADDRIIIFVRKGTYDEVKNALNIGADGWDIDVVLIGEDRDDTIIKLEDGEWGWKFDQTLRMDNITFEANGSYVAPVWSEGDDVNLYNSIIKNNYTDVGNTGGVSCLKINSTLTGTNFQILNCQFIIEDDYADTGGDGARAAISIMGQQDKMIIKNNYIKTANVGIYFAGDIGNENCELSSNIIEMIGDGSLARGKGIYISGTNFTKGVIANNTIYSADDDYAHGIYLNGGQNAFTYNQIVGNIVTKAEIGIYATGAGIIISNNTCDDCTDTGLYAVGSVYSETGLMSITNNMISNCDVAGIHLSYSNIQVTGNSIYGCLGGITDSNNQMNNINMSNNYFRRCTISIKFQELSAYSEGLNISNNTIVGVDTATGTAIDLERNRVQDSIISNNYITEVEFGMYVEELLRLNIIGNYFDQIGGSYAISVWAGAEMKVISNVLSSKIMIPGLAASGEIAFNKIADKIEVVTGSVSGKIIGNSIDISDDHAIDIDGNFTGIISGNIIQNAGTYRSINIETNMDEGIISDNKLGSSSGGECLYVAGTTTKSNITGNVMKKGDGYYGMYFAGDVDVSGANDFKGSVISNNSIFSNSTSGNKECIYMAGNCSDSIFSGNRLWSGNGSSYVIKIVSIAKNCIFSNNRNAYNLAGDAVGPPYIKDGISVGTNTNNVWSANIKT